MAAASLWGVTTGGLRTGEEDGNSPVIQHFEWSQICQRWAINTLIAVIVLTLLALLVTYFGHTFSYESNRVYFLILLVSLFVISLLISALFCTNRRRKAPSDQKTPNETTHTATGQQRTGVAHDSEVNSAGAVNEVAVDL